MIRILLYDGESDTQVDGHMPVLPQKGDLIGIWINKEWCICEVDYLVHEFDANGDFIRTEINIKRPKQ